jgi:hypothetical protein
MKRIVNINGQTKEEVLISKLQEENRNLKRQITELNQALQLQQAGVVRSNLIDESPEPRINVHRFNESDYHDGKFLK